MMHFSMFCSVCSQTVTATGTAGNFSLSLPSIAEGEESGWILADVIGGDVATNAEVKAAVESIAGQVRRVVVATLGWSTF